MYKFREINPVRTCKKTFPNYQSYKQYLAEDFNHRCGYTNCSDRWLGGQKTFHIDHFLPVSTHLDKKCDYSNLVYACSYVNISKSDIEGPFLDPCNINYNDHFERNEFGDIIPKTPQAEFMYINLRLYMKRYGILWMLDELYDRMEKLKKLREKMSLSETSEMMAELTTAWMDYFNYLQKNQ